MVSLDGGNRVVGTEFIKLLSTGSSDLATEEYVDNAVANGGGGGGNVDLSNYYTQAETNTLLNAKLNVNNPQDITGNLRLDPTNGNSKIILNAVSPPNASDDFYCNGNSHINGTLRVSVLTSDGDVNCDGVNADTFNSHIITNDIIFNHNDNEYMRFNATDDEIQLSKDIDVGSSKIICNSFDSGLSDVVFNLNSNEFLRFQLSDNTVRVPNTKSFLSQNIFTDIIQPLAFANDVVLNGGNSTNDAYEEYMRLDASTERVNVSKTIDTNEHIYMNLNKRLYLNDTVGSERYIVSTFRSGTPSFNQLDIVNENSSNGRIRLMIDTEENVIIENSQLYSRRVITANAGVNSNTYNSNGDNNTVFQRDGNEFLRLDKTNDNITCSKEIVAGDAVIVDVAKKLTMRPTLEPSAGGDLNIFDIRNLHPVASNPLIRFRCGEGGGETIICHMSNDAVSVARNLVIGTTYELKCNTINTNGSNDLIFQRNDVEFFKLDKFTEDTVEKEAIICSKQLRANGQLLVNNLQINQFSSGVQFADFRLENTDSVMRFYVGNGTSANFQMTNDGISLNRQTTIGSIKTNTINSNGDNDLVFQRNGIEYFRLDDLTGTDILNIANDKGVSASYVFGNRFWNRSFSSDTTFFGSNVAGDDRVEYMKWNYLSQSVDYNAPIDNTGLAITGNIIDTTVSDERLKTNIEDVDTDFTSCIKNVKVKTFEYKDDKYKTNDTYGFIAQELKEHLPKECKNIVKENKVKNEDETFLSINYMKLSVVLWKCCQEQQSKIEHLESRLFELEDIVKEMRGKGKGEKPKAKAKAKNVK